MTRDEYEQLRRDEPQLILPEWGPGPIFAVESPFVRRVMALNRDDLIAVRTAYLLKGGAVKFWILYDA